VSRLRPIAAPFVVAAPAGARIRTRLRTTADDDAVLEALGSHLGALAGRTWPPLRARPLDARGDIAVPAAAQARNRRLVVAVGWGDHALLEDAWQLPGATSGRARTLQ